MMGERGGRGGIFRPRDTSWRSRVSVGFDCFKGTRGAYREARLAKVSSWFSSRTVVDRPTSTSSFLRCLYHRLGRLSPRRFRTPLSYVLRPDLEQEGEVVEDVPRIFVQVERQLNEHSELGLQHALLAHLPSTCARAVY